jgi:hypothetical protein|tara:strand:+ start:18429 stop:19055 length:627 start_codon:yes stop_codon:yes gene_type:complete
MKKTISFSLYGENESYINTGKKCVIHGREKYPDWEWRIYVGKSIPNKDRIWFQSHGCSIVNMTGREDTYPAMFWRFLAAGDSDIAIFRDLDGPLLWREKLAVDEWLASDKTLHIMKDNKQHGGWHILGGMWGIKGGIKEIKSMIDNYHPTTDHAEDQIFLRDCVLPIFDRSDIFIHDSSNPETPFPTERIEDEHVGMSFPNIYWGGDY